MNEIRKMIAQAANCKVDDLNLLKTPRIYSLHLDNEILFFGLNSLPRKRWFLVCSANEANKTGIQNIKRLYQIELDIIGTHENKWIHECRN